MFTLQDLTNAGLPAIETDGNGMNAQTSFSRELTPAEWQTYLSISDPERGNYLSNRQEIRTDAETAMASLQTFIGNSSPSNAEVIAVIKLLCRAVIRIIRVLLQMMRQFA